VNIGEHSLKNSVKVQAIFASEIPREVGGGGDTANGWLLTSDILSALHVLLSISNRASFTILLLVINCYNKTLSCLGKDPSSFFITDSS